MLVLTRRVGQAIVINGEIRIRLVAAGKGRARLGILAPLTVRVDRKEIDARRSKLPATEQEAKATGKTSHPG